MPLPFAKLFRGLTSLRGAALIAPVVIGSGLLLAFGSGQASSTSLSAAGKAAAIQPASKPDSQTTPHVIKIADTFSPEQEKAIGEIVRKYLLANPNVLVEVSQELERRQNEAKSAQQLKLLSSQKAAIFHSPDDFVMGKKDAKITVVEFFDYNCGWCKRAVGEVSKLVKEDPNVRIVMKEFPIFGEHSDFAAHAALASRKQGKYWPFHVAMMKTRRVTKDNVFKIAESVGIDVAKLKADMADPAISAAIKRNMSIAHSLGIEGTPGFIIDGQINPGYLPVAALKQMIADVREKGCKVC